MGKDGFQWFVGVVEDRQNSKKLGRVRVRCLNITVRTLVTCLTSNLLWAHPMNPITSATVSGVGQTPLGAVEGTWVIGFFQDGAEAQHNNRSSWGRLRGFVKSYNKGGGKGFKTDSTLTIPSTQKQT